VSTSSRTLLVLAAVASAACFLPPDPVEPAPGRTAPGSSPSSAEDATGVPVAGHDSLVDGAWRPAEPRERAPGSTSRAPRVASALSVGTWSAQVQPRGSERLPDVSLWLSQLVLPGEAAGSAEYRFDGYRCRYSLYLEEVDGNTVRLRQRLEQGRCAGPGRIILAWEGGESLVGDWLRPDGTPWFRAVLSRAEGVSAVPGGGRGRAAGPAVRSDREGAERVP